MSPAQLARAIKEAFVSVWSSTIGSGKKVILRLMRRYKSRSQKGLMRNRFQELNMKTAG